MTRDEINAFVARRREAWKRHDVEALTRDHAEDCEVDSPLAGHVKGRAAIETVYRGLLSSFPDLSLDGEERRVYDFAGMLVQAGVLKAKLL